MDNSSQEVFKVSCIMYHATYSFKSELPSENWFIFYIIALVFNGILIIPTIILNGVSIITISKSSQLNCKPCYFIILLQSVVDLTVGVFGIPLFLAFMVGKMGQHSNCAVLIIGHTTTVLMVIISAIVLSTMTLERYIAVLHPFAYKIVVTKKRILMCVFFASLLFFSVVILSQLFRFLVIAWTIAQSTVFFLFIAFAYARIFLVVKKLARIRSKANLTKTMMFLQDIRHARSCFVVVSCYVVLHYIPVMLVAIFKNVDSLREFNYEIYGSLCLLNSSVNSVIFFWTKTMLRKEAAKFLKSLKRICFCF